MIFHIENFFIRVRMQKLCPFYKFSRDFANKVEIHICKFSQQLDHISHGKLIFFYFFDISLLLFYFFKTEKAIHRGGVEFENGTFSPGLRHKLGLKGIAPFSLGSCLKPGLKV